VLQRRRRPRKEKSKLQQPIKRPNPADLLKLHLKPIKTKSDKSRYQPKEPNERHGWPAV
jgi:hypothetical protein